MPPVGGEDDAVGLFDVAGYVVGMSKISDIMLTAPFFYLCGGDGDGVAFVEKTQQLEFDG